MNLEKPKWPDGKKCAAMLTINLNAELFWLQIDPSWQRYAKDPFSWPVWNDKRSRSNSFDIKRKRN